MVRISVKEEMSKTEEMDLLRSIQKAIPVNSYLHSLFSEELIQSFQGSMMNDVSCDVYGDLIKSSQNDLDRVLSAQCETQKVVSSLTYQEKVNDELQNKINELKSKIEDLQEKLYKKGCELNRCSESLNNMIERQSEADEQIETMKAKLSGE